MKLGGGPNTADANSPYTGTRDPSKCIGRWRRWVKEDVRSAALLWSERRGGHDELLWPPEVDEVAGAGEGDGSETADVEEVELEVEFESGGPGVGR